MSSVMFSGNTEREQCYVFREYRKRALVCYWFITSTNWRLIVNSDSEINKIKWFVSNAELFLDQKRSVISLFESGGTAF